MYHQVCERKADPWDIAVHPMHFQAHLEYLRKHFDLLSAEELAKGISKGKMKRAVAITFDDGFRDNYTNAAPLLDWLEIPATFYVATTPVEEGTAYWWDTLQHVLFDSAELPGRFEMMINGECVRFTFCCDQRLTQRVTHQIRAWNFNLPVINERIALYMLLWHRLRPLDYAQQEQVIREIAAWAGGRDLLASEGVPMNIRELQVLSQNPLFTIGAHSVHHAMLPHQGAAQQAFEVAESKRQLEHWLGKPVNGFAYPYGHYSTVTQRVLREAGFAYAVSTEPKAVTADDDPFALPRLQVRNWNVYEFASKIEEMIHE